MKFEAGKRRKPIEYEKALIKYWRDNKTFEKSVEQRPAADSYVFYDGPPFLTGLPHHGSLLSSIVKDAVPRYQTMKGKRVERVWGWDTHGLPAEVATEKKLGIHDRRDIGTKISLEDYINATRANMVQTSNEWEDTIARIGRWVDFKGAYKTMDKDYMESVWWAFKKLYDEGKIYEGEKVLLYCTRDATPIAKAEVAMDNSYQDVTDPSVFVKFKLTEKSTEELKQMRGLDAEQGSGEERNEVYENVHRRSTGAADTAMRQEAQRAGGSAAGQAEPAVYLLAWTTTPWTLPANTAAAVNAKLDYVEVELDGQYFILAEELADKVLTDEKHAKLNYKVIQKMKGKDLVGKEYEPLFANRGKNAHKVWAAPYVTTEEGTGIVHLAPAYGEEDYELAKAEDFPMVSVIDDSGFYTEGDWKGQLVWDVNKDIAKTLHERGDVWKIEYITHSYPHCHRCGTRLMYRAHPSWFMRVSDQRQLMLEQNGNINWFPPHFKLGRFAKNIEQAPDWNLSRDRFWATALPVWKGTDAQGEEHIKVVGSYAELKELSGVELEDYHRPWIDEVKFEIDGVKYERIDRVMDSWFEAGSMPFAQFHYPFENVQKFEQNFPGDFIAEYVGQVRAWFYYLHALSVGLFGVNSFNNVIVTGTIAGNDGRKMSKNFGNYTDPNELMDEYSADALRFLFLSSPLLNGEDFALKDKEVSDVHRKLQMVWNMYDFFTLYASVDGWEWNGQLEDPYQELEHPLDQWIISRVHELTSQMTADLDRYDLPNALKGVLPFIDDASNWYIRRSRKRFWKSSNDKDKDLAYKTLHYVLVRLSLVLAPFTPFLAEELYKNLTGGESVHLCDWPPAGHVDTIILNEMTTARLIIRDALSIRADKGFRVRQPLSSLTYSAPNRLRLEIEEIVKDETNVKEVNYNPHHAVVNIKIGKDNTGNMPMIGTKLDTNLTAELKREGLARELIRHIQQARKNAGLNVDDRIHLKVESDSAEVMKAFSESKDEIYRETLTTGELSGEGHEEALQLEGAKVTVRLKSQGVK